MPLDLTYSMTSMALQGVSEDQSEWEAGDSLLGDPGHVLAVRVFPQERTRPDNDIDTVNTRLDGESGVVHVASNVRQDLGSLEAERTDCLAVVERFGRGGGRGELDVFDAEFVEAEGEG